MNEIQTSDIYDVARRHHLDAGKIIDFSVSVNPLGPSPKIRKKLGKEGLSAILRYPDPQCSELRRALARLHGLEEDRVLPGPGSNYFIHSIPRALKIHRALIITPAFSEYEAALESSGEGCEIHYLETTERDGFELNVEGLMLALTQGYDALYLCNPNSPTGILTERRDLLRVLARTEEQRTWFILDEAFIDFLPLESLADLAGACSRLVILRSFSHFFGLPGLRLGYVLSGPECIRNLSALQPSWSVNGLAQAAALESLQDLPYISRTVQTIRTEREFLTKSLQGTPGFIPYPSAANFLFIQLHPSLRLTAGKLREQLIPRGILIRDCSSFHHVGPYFFRVAVRTRRENQALLRALRRVHRDLPEK